MQRTWFALSLVFALVCSIWAWTTICYAQALPRCNRTATDCTQTTCVANGLMVTNNCVDPPAAETAFCSQKVAVGLKDGGPGGDAVAASRVVCVRPSTPK
jgi:hypothetical protein